MRFLRMRPAVCAMISWPFSSFTRNVALGRELRHHAWKLEQFLFRHVSSLVLSSLRRQVPAISLGAKNAPSHGFRQPSRA